jgi:hypothetical protein
VRKAWEAIDLAGGGLQTVNVRLRQAMRKRTIAYGLWLLFPVGAHRFYLRSPGGGLVYLALSISSIVVAVTVGRPYPWPGIGLLSALALFDLWWIDGAVTRVNKALRMSMLLRRDVQPPAGYRGRYTDDGTPDTLVEYLRIKERERAGHPSVEGRPAANDTAEDARAPSFAAQEAMLKQLARRRGKTDD